MNDEQTNSAKQNSDSSVGDSGGETVANPVESSIPKPVADTTSKGAEPALTDSKQRNELGTKYTTTIQQNQTMNEEDLRKERQKIAKDVQNLLTLKLEKHEIEPDIAKEIAMKVVEELRGAKTHYELENLIPHLSEEFAELKDILMLEIKHRREDLDKLISKIVLELIKHEKFQKAIEVAKIADIDGETLQEFDDAEARVNALINGTNTDTSQPNYEHPPAPAPQPVQSPQTPPQPAPAPQAVTQAQPNLQGIEQPTSQPIQSTTGNSESAQITQTPNNTAEKLIRHPIPTEGSTANSFPNTPEFSPTPQEIDTTQEAPSLTDKIQEGIGKLKPITEKATQKAKEGISKITPITEKIVNKAKDVVGKTTEDVHKPNQKHSELGQRQSN